MTIIKAALNGARNKDENPNVPVLTNEILQEAVAVIAAGAEQIHFHVRDKFGNETLDNDAVCEQLSALRNHLPNIQIGISTGEWIEPDFNKRKYLIKSWTVLPDFVSLNLSEPNFEEIAKILVDKGISIEAGLSNLDDAQKLVESGLYNRCFRFLIEPQEKSTAEALTHVLSIEKTLSKVHTNQRILLHGADSTVWDLISNAFEKKIDTRIGFEDTIYVEPNILAKSNCELISKAISIRREIYGC